MQASTESAIVNLLEELVAGRKYVALTESQLLHWIYKESVEEGLDDEWSSKAVHAWIKHNTEKLRSINRSWKVKIDGVVYTGLRLASGGTVADDFIVEARESIKAAEADGLQLKGFSGPLF